MADRFTVHEANAPADLFYVRDETTQQPVERKAWTFDEPEKPDEWLFTSRQEAREFARRMNSLDPRLTTKES